MLTNQKSKDGKKDADFNIKKLDFNIINRGKIKANIKLMPENDINFAKNSLSLKNIKTDQVYTLEPKATMKVEVVYSPTTRMPQFNQDIIMKVNDTEIRKLITVSGASYGVEVRLVGEIPSFGTVDVSGDCVPWCVLQYVSDPHPPDLVLQRGQCLEDVD